MLWRDAKDSCFPEEETMHFDMISLSAHSKRLTLNQQVKLLALFR